MPPPVTTEAEAPQASDAQSTAPAATRAGGLDYASIASGAQVVLATIAVLAVCYVAKMVFIILLVSILLAFVLAPIADVLERIRFPRSLASLVAELVLLAAIFGAVTYSYAAAQEFARELPKDSGQVRNKLTHYMEQAERIQRSTQSVLPSSQQKQPQTVVVQQQTNWTDFL